MKNTIISHRLLFLLSFFTLNFCSAAEEKKTLTAKMISSVVSFRKRAHDNNQTSTLKKIVPVKKHRCSFCSKSFTSSTNVIRHIRTHTGEKPFACDICGKKFAENGNLNKHKLFHARKTFFQCTLCKKEFVQNPDLKRHMRTHTGEKPFTCIECKIKFSDSSNLKVHARTHTKEIKPKKRNRQSERTSMGIRMKERQSAK